MSAEPRTAGEFFAMGKCAIQHCPACGAVKSIDPDILCMTFGDDFDMRAGTPALQAAFSCSICGTPRPHIRFEDDLEPDAAPVTWSEERTRA